jgi:DNA-binding SARP family transcriptional activator/tetratricopeptide (TPR) repeat protein/energy-coupling factor transporter ATP-binding protein EcfA2
VSVRLLLQGVPQVQVAGEALDPDSMPRASSGTTSLALRDAAMLSWLAIVGPTTRAQMAAILWVGRGEEQGRNSLRQRLFQMRRSTGLDLVTSGLVMSLAPGVTHDLDEGPGLLGDATLAECPALDAWLTAMRQQRTRQHRTRLIEELDTLEQRQSWDAAIDLAERVVELDPTSEHAHRRVMRLHYLHGDRAAALLAFDRLEQRLKDDVGTRPDAASLALLRTIERAEALPTSPRGATPRAALPTTLLRPPQLVGRERELALLQEHLQSGRVVALIGEAGQGKSRLLQALAAARPGTIVWTARSGDALTPCATIARGLRELMRLMPEGSWSSIPAGVRADLARVAPEPGGAGADTDAQSSSSPALAVKHLLRTTWPKGTTLVLDDVHFADEASLELLQLASEGEARRPWGLVLAMRPSPRTPRAHQWLQALVDTAQLATLTLEPLSVQAIERLVDSLELPGVEGHELAAALHLRTGGNALFALETLKLAWAESTLHDPSRLPRPSTVTQLIEQQLLALSPQALMLARVAALAGVDFSLELAVHVLERHALELADAWQELEAHQVIRGTSFAHDLVHETVRAGVPEAIGAHLHARIAAWLAVHEGDPARIAVHHEAAGQGALAVPNFVAAARRAHEALRENERIGFLLRAADLSEQQGQRSLAFDQVQSAVEAHMIAIRQTDGMPLLDRLDALAQTPRERALAAQVRGYYHGNVGEWAQATTHGEHAWALARSVGDADLEAMARQRLGTAYAMTGRFEEALEHLQAALPRLEARATPDEARECYGNLALTLDNAGRVDEALRMHRQGLKLAGHGNDHAQHATLLANLAVNRLNAGDVTAAREALSIARHRIDALEASGSRSAFIALLQGRCDRALGHYDETLALFEHARSVARARNAQRVPVVCLHEAQCWLDLGAFDRASQALDETLRDTQLMPHHVARALVLKARLARALGQRGDALLDQAHAVAPLNGWHEVRHMVAIERAPRLGPVAALDELEQIAQQAYARGLRGIALAALLQACEIAADHAMPESPFEATSTLTPATQNPQPPRVSTTLPRSLAPAMRERGHRLARRALIQASAVEAESGRRADRWLQPARALLAAGERDDAAAVLMQGHEWLSDVAARHVPERWRDSFMTRVSVHARLVALAAQLGLPEPWGEAARPSADADPEAGARQDHDAVHRHG